MSSTILSRRTLLQVIAKIINMQTNPYINKYLFIHSFISISFLPFFFHHQQKITLFSYSFSFVFRFGLVVLMMRLETVPFTRVGSRTSVLFDAPRDHEVCSTTSSSSIGRNSDDVSSERSMDESVNGENEAESAYNGGALHHMEALEEVLPIR